MLSVYQHYRRTGGETLGQGLSCTLGLVSQTLSSSWPGCRTCPWGDNCCPVLAWPHRSHPHILGPGKSEPDSSGPIISGSASSFQSFLPLALGPCTAPHAQQYLLLCMEAFPRHAQRIFISSYYLSLHMKCGFPLQWFSKDKGPCCFSFSLKHQSTDPARNRWVWKELWCLVHTPVLGAADQIQEKIFIFFLQIIWGLSLGLVCSKSNNLSTI